MKALVTRLAERSGKARVLALLLVVAGFGLGIWFLSADARREIDALATANADSTQWSLAQSEVEYLRLRTALLSATPDDPAMLDEVRRRFDVFYSRIQTVRTSPSFGDLRRMPQFETALGSIQDFLDAGVPLIDAPDTELAAAMDVLGARAAALREELRMISLAGVRVFAERSELQRMRVAAALFDLALVSILLIGLMLAFVFALVRLLRSSRKRTEQIQIKESRLRAIATTSLDAILVVGRDGRILDYNGAAQGVFGYTPDEAIGRDMAELIVPDHLRNAHDAGMRRHLDTGETRVTGRGRVQLEAKDKSGRVFPVELSISTAQSEEGEIYVSFLRDISSRLVAERELIDTRDKALAGEKAKADLLAIMSHEMRTPLNGILGTLQLLEATPLDPRQRDYAGVIATSGQMLLRHVNTVLDISRIDAGGIEISRDIFEPEDTVRDIAGALTAQASARGNRIHIRPAGTPPGRVVGDEPLLRQILTNLIGNAIKFTDGGDVTVEYERMAEEDLVEFRVIDTGIGIAEADCERIFEDFVTLDPSYTRTVEGTGLGLGIVQRLVSVMGGEIGVESEPGIGSVFWFRVPLALAQPGTAPAQVPQESAATTGDLGADVLLVEDNEINRMVARDMLAAMGCRVTEAHDGREGVARADERSFDLILMDISMPNLDGIEATRLIRGGDGPNAQTPVIALTAHALPADIDRFHAAGMSNVVMKPIDRARLAAALSQERGVRRTLDRNPRRTATGTGRTG